ncbi:hypothetical protein VTG60DRAFT_4430 [Thermothelomyces hinnuleus]
MTHQQALRYGRRILVPGYLPQRDLVQMEGPTGRLCLSRGAALSGFMRDLGFRGLTCYRQTGHRISGSAARFSSCPHLPVVSRRCRDPCWLSWLRTRGRHISQHCSLLLAISPWRSLGRKSSEKDMPSSYLNGVRVDDLRWISAPLIRTSRLSTTGRRESGALALQHPGSVPTYQTICWSPSEYSPLRVT